jgi:hypothetical protein
MGNSLTLGSEFDFVYRKEARFFFEETGTI